MNPLQLVLIILSGGVGLASIGWLLLKQFGWWSVSLFLGVMIAVAVVTLIVRFWRKRKGGGQAADKEQARQQAREQAREQTELRRRREQLIVAAVNSAFRMIKARTNGDPYRLPLYLMIGPEDSGKSQLLKSFGLVCMSSPELEQAESLLEVWCSEYLMIVKFWGHLYDHSEESCDGRTWEYAIARLLKQRPRRCLNGIVVTLPVTLLTTMSEDERIVQGRHLRRSLQDIGQMVGQHLPVYLLVSQCDLLSGFAGAFHLAMPGEVAQCFRGDEPGRWPPPV